MDVDLEIELFNPTIKTNLALDDSVNVNELLEYVQQTFQDQFIGVNPQSIQIKIGGTGEIIQPSQKTLKEILRGQRRAKLSFQLLQQTPSGSLDFQSQSQNHMPRNNPQVQNFVQQNVLNSQMGRTIDVLVKSGTQQTQIQLDDSVTIEEVIQHLQENMNINPTTHHLYYNQTNLSLQNQRQTLRQLGIQSQSQLEWKLINQINQQAQQFPFMTNQGMFQRINQTGQGQPQVNQQYNFQQTNMGQQLSYQQQQQFQQQQYYQQQQQQQQQYQQQQQQFYNQVNQTQQQQQQQQQQVLQTNQQQAPKQMSQQGITINFDIHDGNIKRQFSTYTFPQNSLLELLDAVYQYLGISKEVASIDLYIGNSPFTGDKLQYSLEKLQLFKNNQTFQVKVRWMGG